MSGPKLEHITNMQSKLCTCHIFSLWQHTIIHTRDTEAVQLTCSTARAKCICVEPLYMPCIGNSETGLSFYIHWFSLQVNKKLQVKFPLETNTNMDSLLSASGNHFPLADNNHLTLVASSRFTIQYRVIYVYIYNVSIYIYTI